MNTKGKAFNALASLLLLALLFSSCEKEVTVTPDPQIDEEEIVAIVEGALIAETEGITTEAVDAAKTTEVYVEQSGNPDALCGTSFDTLVVRNYNSTRVTADYSSTWGWTVNCNDLNIPTTLDFNRSTQGNYETLRMQSSDSASGSWTVGNLITGSTFIINGAYEREGNQLSKIRDQNTFTTELDFIVTDLTIGKTSQEIESGQATFNLLGESSNGISLNYNGTIEFQGDGIAILTINGNTYQIELG